MARKNSRKNESRFHGVVLVDKPIGVTSHDVVDRVRKIFGTRRVGHTGTLDPQATGLLVLLLGEATKISEYLISHDKSYEGGMKLGVVSDTYDAEGQFSPGPGGKAPTTVDEAQDIANDFIGEIDQVPPIYSAKKVAGKKLYEYAREGTPVEIEPRKTRVDDFEILTVEGDHVTFGVDCGPGTYVRSLVHDFGQSAGCGAVLTELRRTDLGSFSIEHAKTLEQLDELAAAETLGEAVLPIRKALPEFATVFLGAGAERWIRHGQPIPANLVHVEGDARPRRGALTVLCRLNGEAVAIARVDISPVSPPPRALMSATPPWFQPLKQFDIPLDDAEPDEEG